MPPRTLATLAHTLSVAPHIDAALLALADALTEIDRFARVGLVRFNPFEDTGGNQSFALALTDVAGDGFVVSSLHSRTGTRVYAKAISDGRSDGALSQEESAALRLALAGPAAGPPSEARGRDRVAGPA